MPPNIDAAIRKALEKVPADRFREVATMAAALGDSRFRHGRLGGQVGSEDTRRWRSATIATTAVVAAVVGLVAFAIGTAIRSGPDAPPRGVARFEITFRPGQEPVIGGRGGEFALSRDGTLLVYQGPPVDDRANRLVPPS